jgi:hypothetical protein
LNDHEPGPLSDIVVLDVGSTLLGSCEEKLAIIGGVNVAEKKDFF